MSRPSSLRRRSLLAAIAAATLTLCGLTAVLYATGSEPPGEDDARPNIVFILTDDQSIHSFRRELMPNTFERVVDPGIRLDQAIAAPPLCCPYRAGVLTGQYPQNHGVSTNDPGYPLLEDKGNVLPAWLDRADYTTALVGKFLNGYRGSAGTKAAPGWDEWFEVELAAGYFDPVVDDAGRRQRREGYITDILTDRANEFIAEQAASSEPFFLWLTHYAPHGDSGAASTGTCPSGYAQPRREDLEAYDGPPLAEVRRPSFNELNVSDKPPKISGRERLGRTERREIALRFRCAAAAIERVDDGVGSVLDTLERTGQLDETIVIYTSDNGQFYGEHRLRKGKSAIFEEALNVPLAIRVPTGYPGTDPSRSASSELVAQQDLTAGILQWAEADPCIAEDDCRTLDGRSVIDLLERGSWGLPRAIPFELFRGCPRRQEGVRTERFAFQRPGDNEGCAGREESQLYDLRRDPAELRNLVGADRAEATRLRMLKATRRLTQCAGIRGRDPRTPGRPFCR